VHLFREPCKEALLVPAPPQWALGLSINNYSLSIDNYSVTPVDAL
jgi:hypothetical protein